MGRLRYASGSLILGLAICLCGCGPTTGEATGSPRVPPTAQGSGSDPSADPGTSGEPLPSGPASTSTPFTGPVWQSLADFPDSDAFQVTGVTAIGDGFTAIGFQAMPGEDVSGRRQGVLWHSPDGRTWEAVTDPAFQFVTPEEIVTLGTTTFVFGTYNTCGLTFDDECVEPPEAGWGSWRSIDGGAWERLPLPVSMQTGGLDGAIGGTGALVAFGLSGADGSSVVWTSADGVTWRETTDLAGMDPVTAMAAGPASLVAFGNSFSSDVDELLPAAVSSDGVHFARVSVPPLEAVTIESVAAGASGFAAVGDIEDLDLNFTGVALHSGDGSTWTRASAADGSFADSALIGVQSVRSGYVAVGITPEPDDFGVFRGMSWFSPDGLSYRSLAPLGDTFTEITASASGPRGFVCFTATEQEPDDETVISTVAAWFAPMEALPTQ